MIPRPGEDNWDFTPVIDLIYSLSTHSEDYTHQKKTGSDSSSYASLELFDSTPNREKNQQVTQLGNFDKVWQYLGQPIDLPPPTVPTGPLLSVVDAWETNDEGEQGTHKGVKWWDGFEGVDLTANDENKIVTGIVELNKTQRKKERRKQRRNALAAQLTDGGILRSNGEDEPEPEPDIRSPTAPDRRAIIYQIVHQTTAETGIARLRSGKIFKTENPIDHDRRPANPPKSAKQIVQIPKPPKEGTFEIAAARKKTLMSMLREKFVDDRQYLNNLSFVPNLNGNHDATAEGIHVFVDASNVCRDLLVHVMSPN